MRIGYISIGDSNDTNTWSGTTYFFAKGLEQLVELERISLEDNLLIKLIHKYYLIKSKLFKKKWKSNRSKIVSKFYAKQAENAIAKAGDLDALISVGTIPIAYLDVDIPIINYSDATFNQMVDYYEEFSNLSHKTIKDGGDLEKRALEKCNLLFYCSDWAKNSAIKDYKINPSKVFSIPFGLNMDEIPDKQDIFKNIKEKVLIETCNLVFVGKDFKRKGGELAYKTLCYLSEEMGINAQLTIIGSNPEIEDSRVKTIPYIDKNNKNEQKLYRDILNQSHFLVLPTKADCFSMVGIESNAYGIPVVTTNTGGLPSLIEDGVNGFTMELNDNEELYAHKIYDNFINKDNYKNLCIKSRRHFEEKTNWYNTCSFIVNKIKSSIK